jgi:hypothetical protein
MADFNMEGGYPDEGIRPTDPLGFLSSRSPAPVSTSSILSVAPGSLSLSIEEQNSMIKSIEDIFGLEEDQKEDEEMVTDEDDEDNEPAVDLEDQARRTEKLKDVLPILAQLWWAGSEQMDLAAEKLADAGRNRKSLISEALPSIHLPFFIKLVTRVFAQIVLCSPCYISFLMILDHMTMLTLFQQNGEYL